MEHIAMKMTASLIFILLWLTDADWIVKKYYSYCHFLGVQVPECLTKFSSKRGSAAKRTKKNVDHPAGNPVEMAKEQFRIAATAGCDLGLKWLQRLEEVEERLLSESNSTDGVSQSNTALL